MMLNNIFQKTMRDQKGALLWYSGGFIFLSVYLCYFFPFISNNAGIFKVIESLPPVIRNLLGDIGTMTSPEGFFQLQPFSYFAPLLVIIFSISKGVETIAGEKDRGTLDLLLSKPVSRTQLIIQKTSASAVSLLIIHMAFFAGMMIGTAIFGITISLWSIFSGVASLYLLSLSFLTISLTAGILFLDPKKAVGILGGFALITFLVNAYAPAVKLFHLIRIFSPFYYNSGNSPVINGLSMKLAFIQILTAFLFFLISILIFKKRDLYS